MTSNKWIQSATRSIKRRGTEGVCTGSKYGSSSCPPGSKRYNLAKTFRNMNKKQEGGNIQFLDDIMFDSDKSRSSSRGYPIVKDMITGLDYEVIRNKDGSYRYKTQEDDLKKHLESLGYDVEKLQALADNPRIKVLPHKPGKRSSYNYFNNSLQLRLPDQKTTDALLYDFENKGPNYNKALVSLQDSYFGELSHAIQKQRYDDLSLKNQLNTQIRYGIPFSQKYEKSYSDPSTYEYTAHQQIEPVLKDSYNHESPHIGKITNLKNPVFFNSNLLSKDDKGRLVGKLDSKNKLSTSGETYEFYRNKKDGTYTVKKLNKGGQVNYANTPYEQSMGVLAGKNGFRFKGAGPHKMTMTPNGVPVKKPLRYEGYYNGKLVDKGVAYPGQEEFYVRGNDVREYPIYQAGSLMDVYPPEYPINYGEPQAILYNDTPVPASNYDYMSNIPKPVSTDTLPLSKDTPGYKVSSMTGYSLPERGGYTSQVDNSGIIQANREAQPGNNTPTGVNYDNDIFGKIGDGVKKAYEVDPYKVGMTDIPLASGIYNLSQAFHKIKEDPYYNQEAQEALAGMRKLKYTPNFYYLQTMGNRAMNAVRGSVGSVPGMLANLNNISTNVGNQMTNEAYKAAQVNNEYQSQYLRTLYGEGAQRAQERKYAMDRNLQHSARQRQHWAALAQGADAMMKNRRLLTQQKMQDEMSAEGINASTPDYHLRYNPSTKRMERYWRNPETKQWIKIERDIDNNLG